MRGRRGLLNQLDSQQRRARQPSQQANGQPSARTHYFQRQVRVATDPRSTWNYYDVLGVPHNATEDTIVRAYERLYREFYAGRSHDPGTAAILREIVEALDVLTDPARRMAYDSLPLDQQPPGRPDPPPPASRRKAGCFPVILAIPPLVCLFCQPSLVASSTFREPRSRLPLSLCTNTRIHKHPATLIACSASPR